MMIILRAEYMPGQQQQERAEKIDPGYRNVAESIKWVMSKRSLI